MFFRHNYPALLWALLILGLCALPGSRLPHLTFLDWLRPDKIVHLFLFGVLTYLLVKGFSLQTTFAVLNHHPKLYAVLLSCIYGIIIELLQEYVFYGRSGDLFDAIADAAGALIGLWIYNSLSRLVKKFGVVDNKL